MPPSLGTIWIDLQANVGGFVSALSKAAAEAQKTSKEIGRSFRDLGEIASQTFGAFGEELNPIVSKLSFVISSAGWAASSAMKEFSSFGGALGSIGALGAGAAVGLAAVGATAIGVAMHAAEGAEKLLQLSRSTGVSVEALSALQFAARQTGIDQEQLVKSLQLLSTNMVKAAKAPKDAATAFSDLGLNIRQQNGDLKNAAQFMGEVIAKLSDMRDKTAAVGLARQMMGKGGAAILQLGDPEEVQHWIDKAKELGIVIDTQTAVAAERFEQTLGILRATAEGTANRLMESLLPALQAVASELEKASKPGAGTSGFIDHIKSLTQYMLSFAGVTTAAFNQVLIAMGAAMESIEINLGLIKNVAEAATDVVYGDFVGAAKAAGEGWKNASEAWGKYGGIRDAFIGDSKKTWLEYQNFLTNAFKDSPDSEVTKHKGGKSGLGAPGGPGAGGRPDVVAELVAKLQAQAAAELDLASATEKSTSATILAKAAAEAETKTAEMRAHLLEHEKELREKLASEPDSKHAPTLQAEIADVQKMLAELEKYAPQIRALYAEIASAGFAAKSSAELEKFTVKTTEETTALREMAAAYSEGPAAAQRAEENKKIAPFEKQHADLGELIPALKIAGAPEADVAKLQTAYDQLGAAIDRAKASVTAFTSAEISEKIAKDRAELTAQAEAYSIVGKAALKSAADQREAAAQAEASKFAAKNPTATPEMVKGIHDDTLEKLSQERSLTIAQESAQYSLNAAYSQELEKLQEIRSFLQSSGESTISIDTKIYETKIQHTLDYQKQVFESQNQEILGEQKIYQMGVQLTEEWDRAAMEVGTLGEKFRAMINEVELQGSNIGSKLFESMGKAFEDLSSTLSKFIVTGKNGFRQMVEGWEESLVKLSLQKTFSLILQKVFPQPGQPGQVPPGQNGPWSEQIPGAPGAPGAAGGKGGLGAIAGPIASIFGIKMQGTPGTRKPDGTSTDPLYVVISKAAASPLGPEGVREGSGFGDLFGKGGNGDFSGEAGGTSPAGPASAFSGLSGLPIVGGLFGSLGKMFGGQETTGTGKPDGSQSNPLYTISTTAVAAGAAGGSGGSGGSAMSSVTSMLGIGDIFSGTGGAKADGSQSNPFYVVSKSDSSSSSGGMGGLLSSFGGGDSSGDSGGDSGGGGGGGLIGLLSMAFMASGGRVSKGTPYIVGEDRPEVFVPDQHGKIVPSISHFANSPEAKAMKSKGVSLAGMSHREYGGSVTAGTPYLTGEKRPEVFVPNGPGSGGRATSSHASHHSSTLNLHVHGVKDADSFKQSQSQIYANYQREAAIAHMRTRQ
jgi:hypothetical protein